MTAITAWLWQGLLLAAVIDLLLRAMPRPNAATRHLAWWGALAGVLLLGAVHAGGNVPAVSVLPAPVSDPAALSAASVLTLPEAPGWVLALALALWIGAAIHGLVRVLQGMRRVVGLRNAAVPLDEARASRLPLWSGSRGHGREAQLCVTGQLVGACALGFRRPIILVSRQLLETLDDEALDQVVMHEQAHLDRYDDWLRLLQSVVTAMAVIHPAVHIVGRRIDLEREAACDDRVVSATGAADRYAACLMAAAAVAASRVPATVPSVLGGRSSARSLRARIVRLLDPRPDHGRRLVASAIGVVAVWLTVVLTAAPQLPSLVTFVRAAAPLPAPQAAPVVVSSALSDAPTPARAPAVPIAQRRAATTPPVARETLLHVDGSPATQSAAPTNPSAWPASQAAPAAGIPPAESLTPAQHGIPTEALGAFSAAITDAPPSQHVADAVAAVPERVAAESTLLSDMSWVGRNSAATAKKAGLSVAGTVTRAGKALGKLF
jgi:beta-lactamase regulating signal transducer with metallopeptidase domain